MESKAAKRIGFIGLGAMGFGMASHLLKSGFHVVAYDVRTVLTFLSFPTSSVDLCVVAVREKALDMSFFFLMAHVLF
jgi:3-hydroxyacyl-CoA dehydrogenase